MGIDNKNRSATINSFFHEPALFTADLLTRARAGRRRILPPALSAAEHWGRPGGGKGGGEVGVCCVVCSQISGYRGQMMFLGIKSGTLIERWH